MKSERVYLSIFNLLGLQYITFPVLKHLIKAEIKFNDLMKSKEDENCIQDKTPDIDI